MKVLLIGGSGQLGSEIRARWTRDDVIAPAHNELDLADFESLIGALAASSPELVVNCAAFHNVDTCETRPDEAMRINALAVDAVAAACAERDVAFMTISTDYVFDGAAKQPYSEDDCPRPVSAYGVSKVAGELLVLRRRMKSYVVRTCGVYGLHFSKSKGHTFIDRLTNQARAGETIRVVADVASSPTYAGHLAVALREIVAKGAYGLTHACNVGPVTWYDFATKALELADIEHPIEQIRASEWKAAARRPMFSALRNARLEALGIHMPSWDEGIAAYLHDKGA